MFTATGFWICASYLPKSIPGCWARMKAQSERFMRDCGYRGILAIEYFIKGGEIYFNEMAPRPA